MTESVSASTRNWARMSRPRAPMALRMPISRVRSRTDTSMMFMMPMPPTTSEMDAMPASRMVSSSLMESTDASSWAWSAMLKSSVPPDAMAWRTLEQRGGGRLDRVHLLRAWRR